MNWKTVLRNWKIIDLNRDTQGDSMMKRLFILFFLFPFVGFAQLHGEVSYVSDGDTFHLVTKDGDKIKVRVAGIDCPERNQAHGLEAKAFVMDEIKGKTVELKVKETDRYGRKVAYVYYSDKDLSAELLKMGLAWHYVKYSDNALYEAMEEKARSQQTGLWADFNAIAPWEFRKLKSN